MTGRLTYSTFVKQGRFLRLSDCRSFCFRYFNYHMASISIEKRLRYRLLHSYSGFMLVPRYSIPKVIYMRSYIIFYVTYICVDATLFWGKIRPRRSRKIVWHGSDGLEIMYLQTPYGGSKNPSSLRSKYYGHRQLMAGAQAMLARGFCAIYHVASERLHYLNIGTVGMHVSGENSK